MKTMNALLKLQEKNLLKYVMFILLTTLLNHDYAIRHVIFYHEWICSRLPIVLKTQWICFRERTYSNDIHSVLSSHLEKEMLQPDFLFGKQKTNVDTFRIKSDMQIIFGTHKSKGGLIRTVQEVSGPKSGGILEDIGISGDFTLVPKESIVSKLEQPLHGKIRTEKDLEPIIEDFFEDKEVEMPGVTPEDVLNAINLTEG